MLVSERQAVRILLTRGQMTGEAQARHLLRAGAAGSATIADTGLLFDSERICELAQRPWLDDHAQEDACPHGVYVARLARATEVDLTRSWREISGQVGRMPAMPTMTTALLAVSVTAAGGRLPWVATLHGFVVHGADLTASRPMTTASGDTAWSSRGSGSRPGDTTGS
jgi:hypothetical protein